MIGEITVRELKTKVLELLASRFPQMELADEFAEKQYFGRLEKPVLAVAVERIEAEHAGFGDYLGSNISGDFWKEQNGQLAKISLDFHLYLPAGGCELESNEVFLELCSELLFAEELDFRGFSCSSSVFEPEIQCFSTVMKAEMQAVLMREERAEMISDIRLETEVSV